MKAGWVERLTSVKAASVQKRTLDKRIRRELCEQLWAWASLLVLIIAWDAASRMDERVVLPSVRIAHAMQETRESHRNESSDL